MPKSKPWIFTKKEFEKVYGKCETWLWKILQDNWKRLSKTEKQKYYKAHKKIKK